MQYKIEDEKIVKMYTSKANKEGKPYVSKKGNPFSKVDIYIDKEAIMDDPHEWVELSEEQKRYIRKLQGKNE